MQQAETARDLICDLLANNCTICQKKVPVVKETQPKKFDSKAKNRQSLSPAPPRVRGWRRMTFQTSRTH